jgi:DNA repair exonuclease SbcCD ATPase subunit
MPSTTARRIIMTDEETEKVLKSAQDCVESECSIDEVDDLLQVLKSTEKELEDRLEKIMNMIGHLQHINEKPERQTNEVRQFVKDMLRVFSTDVSLTGRWPVGLSDTCLR